MMRKYISSLGKALSRIYGKGLITFSNEEPKKVLFTIVQYSEGDLLFFAEVTLSQYDKLKFSLLDHKIVDVIGEDSMHNPIIISNFGPLIRCIPIKSSNKFLFLAYLNEFEVIPEKISQNSYIEFNVANLKFGSSQRNITANDYLPSGSDELKIKFGTKEVKIIRVEDYFQIIERLRVIKGIEVTSKAIVSIDFNDEAKELIAVIDNILSLLSIANSTLVNWISYKIYSNDNKTIGYGFRNSITKDFNSSSVINTENIANLQQFLEKGMYLFPKVNKIYNVSRLTRAYTETRSGPFLETRTLLISSIVESFANSLVKQDGNEYLMDVEEFISRWKTVKKTIKLELEKGYPELKKFGRIRESLKEVQRSINLLTYGKRIKYLAKNFDANVTEGEISRFVLVRNHLVHDGTFPDDSTKIKDYFLMQHILDKVILRLFDYRGYYHDIEHQTLETI